MNLDKSQAIIAAAVLIILSGGIGFWLGRSAERGEFPGLIRPETGEEPGPDISGVILTGGNAIAVNDQPPGMNVAAALVTLAQDGWVVIHEDADGQPGRILGAQLFNAGQSQSGTVELLRGTEEGRVYYAMLHSDDGDRQFDHTKDLTIRDPQGNIIHMRFVATADVEGL